jgi:hypothetical protein
MLKAPMPSPSGTNYEGLYIPDRGPSAAYDAAPEGGEAVSASAAAKLEEFARGKMNGPDYAEFMQLLKSFSGGVSADEDVENEEERQERLAKRGNEWDGAYSFASDSRVRGDARMTGGCGLEARAVGGKRISTAKAEAEFNKLFPSAGKLSR